MRYHRTIFVDILLALLALCFAGGSAEQLTFPKSNLEQLASYCIVSSLKEATPKHIVVLRHADYLPEDDGYVKGPSLDPDGFARSFALVQWYKDTLLSTAGWPSYVVSLGPTVDGLSQITQHLATGNS